PTALVQVMASGFGLAPTPAAARALRLVALLRGDLALFHASFPSLPALAAEDCAALVQRGWLHAPPESAWTAALRREALDAAFRSDDAAAVASACAGESGV